MTDTAAAAPPTTDDFYGPVFPNVPGPPNGPKPGDLPVGAPGSFIEHFGAQLIPGSAGVAAAPLGVAGGEALGLMTGPFAPIAVPTFGFLGGLGVGYATSYGVGAGQQVAADELTGGGYSAELARSGQAHPIASFAGDLAGMAPFMRFGWHGVAPAVVNAGVTGGIEAGNQYALTGDINLWKVAGAAAFGAAMGHPTLLGEAVQEPANSLAARIPRGGGRTVPRLAADDVTTAGAADYGITETDVQARADALAKTYPNLSRPTLESFAQSLLLREAAGANATPDEKAAGNVIDSDHHAAASNPYTGSDAAGEHGQKLAATTAALETDSPLPDVSRPLGGPPPDRDGVINFIIDRLEGGDRANVDSGGLTRFGISQKAHPEVDVANLTREQAVEIYRNDYWDKLGLDRAEPQLAAVAMDTAINHGVGRARELLAEAGGDPARLIELRRGEYARLIAADPAKYGRYQDGWNARLKELQAFVGEPAPVLRPDVLAAAGDPEESTPPLTVEDYVDRHLAGEGRGDSVADLELQQFGANNADAIKAEFTRRAGLSPAESPSDSAGGFGAEPPATPQAGADAATAGQFDPLPHVPALRDYVKSYQGSLTPEAIAKKLGLTPDQANRVIGAMLSSRDSGVTHAFKKVAVLDAEGKPVMRRGKPVMQRVAVGLRRLPARRGSIDVLTFLKDKGGIRDDEGHDLFKGRGLGQAVGLIRKNGLSIDGAGELLHEARYFLERPTEDEVLQLLERAAREKVYPLHEQEEADHARRSEEMDESEQQARADIAAAIEHVGTLNEDEMVAALRHMARGLDPESAAMAAIEHTALGDAEALAIETDDPGYDIADFEERYDRPAPEGWIPAAEPDRGAAAAPREGSAGPGGDAGDAGIGGQVRPPAAQDLGPPQDLEPFDEPGGEGATAQADALEHDLRAALDLGEAVDPAIAELQRQQAQLGAEAPLRRPVGQESTMGLELFDRADQPGFRLDEEGPLTTARAVLDEIDSNRQALDDLRACLPGGGA